MKWINLQNTQHVIRAMAYIAVLYGVYSETGVVTTLALALIALSTELKDFRDKVGRGKKDKAPTSIKPTNSTG